MRERRATSLVPPLFTPSVHSYLFNIEDDPSESTNLAEAQPAMLAKLGAACVT